jgi:hypothetical protein
VDGQIQAANAAKKSIETYVLERLKAGIQDELTG